MKSSMFKVKTFTFNPLAENTYVVSDDEGRAAIIDCGALYPSECQTLENYVSAEHLTPQVHLLTHGHFDHAFGAAFVFERYGLRPRCHSADLPLLADLGAQMQEMFGHAFACASAPVGEVLTVGEVIDVGDLRFSVLASPGHTPGGVCLYLEAERILFSGDSLFAGSIGRTDFSGGNHWQLIRSLQTLLKTLPAEVAVLPGHGPATSIAAERGYNPYL